MTISLYEHAKRDYEKLGREIKELERRLQHYPEGRLLVYKIQGHRRCYQVYQDLKTHRRIRKYISSSEKAKLERMANKMLSLEDLSAKRKEYKCIQRYLEGHEEELPGKEKRVSIVPEIRTMSNYMSPLAAEYKEWENANFEKNSYPKTAGVKSVLGVEVRSKSEAYIAARLKARGLAVRYECALALNHSTIYPDFTIRDPRTDRLYYWEHMGLLEDEGYAESASQRLAEYAAAGYFPMMNLIITSETKERPLDLALVDYLIDYFFA